jgi:hypothetical protein
MRCVACSRSPAVLVDQAAKPIPALYSAGRDRDQVHRLPGAALTETLMRLGPIVVLDELRQHRFQVPLAEAGFGFVARVPSRTAA